MDAQTLTFVLLLAGFILLVLELFLPSGGTLCVLCVTSFIGSIYFAYVAWAITNPMYWRIYLSVIAVLTPATLYGLYYLLTQTRFGDRILLRAPTSEEVSPYQSELSRLEQLIGQRGSALNLMTPGGLVEVNGERLHAIGEDLMIQPGQIIEVTGIRGTRVVVRIVDHTQSATVLNEPAVAPNEDSAPESPQAS